MRAQRRFLLALVALFFLLFAAACGGDDDSGGDDVASIDDEAADDSGDDDGGSGSEDPPSEEEFQDAMLEYAQCMRDHGVEMEDPEFDGGGGVRIGAGAPGEGGSATEETFEAADEACSPIMEAVAPQEQLSPEEQAELQDQMLEVAQCMRDKGHNMPDPEVGENGEVTVMAEAVPGEEGQAPPEENEGFEDDMQACEEQAGVERRGPGGADDEEEDS